MQIVLLLRAKTINGRANEIRKHEKTMALAKEMGWRVVFRVQARSVKLCLQRTR